MKKPLIGSVSSALTTSSSQAVAQPADPDAELPHGAEIAAAREPAADHDVERLVAQHVEHGRKHGLVVLKVSIHDRDVGRCTDRTPSAQAKARPRRPIRYMHRTFGWRRASARTASAVPSGESSSTNTTSQAIPSSTLPKRLHQKRNVVPLVEGRDHDCEIGGKRHQYRPWNRPFDRFGRRGSRRASGRPWRASLNPAFAG